MGEHYNSWMLWYLLSSIYALAFVIALLKHNVSPKRILFAGFLIAAVGLGCDWIAAQTTELPVFMDIVRKIITVTIGNGRIFTGAIYIPLGMYFKRNELTLKQSAILCVVGFSASLVCEGSLQKIATLICIAGVFNIIINIRLNCARFGFFCRMTSTILYFIHMYVWTAYYVIVYQQKRYGMDCFLATLIGAMIIACAHYRYKYWKPQKS